MRRFVIAVAVLLLAGGTVPGGVIAKAEAARTGHTGDAAGCLHGTMTVTRVVQGRQLRARVCRKSIYVALGDSLAFGFQPNGDLRHGYADALFQYLRPAGIRTLANLSCAGETSATFVIGGCPFALVVRATYHGSQLQTAVRYIRNHRGRIGVVTIDIGGNDFLNHFNKTTCALQADYPAMLTSFDANFKLILAQLKTALRGKAPLIAMNYYNAYANQCAAHPSALADFLAGNSHIAADAALYRVPVVDVFKAFGGAASPNPVICTYTWMCGQEHDFHATTTGYDVIARTFIKAIHL